MISSRFASLKRWLTQAKEEPTSSPTQAESEVEPQVEIRGNMPRGFSNFEEVKDYFYNGMLFFTDHAEEKYIDGAFFPLDFRLNTDISRQDMGMWYMGIWVYGI